MRVIARNATSPLDHRAAVRGRSSPGRGCRTGGWQGLLSWHAASTLLFLAALVPACARPSPNLQTSTGEQRPTGDQPAPDRAGNPAPSEPGAPASTQRRSPKTPSTMPAIEEIAAAAARATFPDGAKVGRVPLIEGETLSALVVVVKPGGALDAHTHSVHEETLMLHRGQGVLLLGERREAMRPGMVAHVPRGVLHSFQNTGAENAVALALFTPGFDEADPDRWFREPRGP
ncbi:MAG: cupin domain-containing protein [Planctomycetes bacterium]|nr:cupin domain-containing protein [Planctomycetota bacterium]